MNTKIAFGAVAILGSLLAKPALAEDALYKRLGGYDAIAAVVDGFIERFVADPELAPFLAPFSEDSKHRIRQHIVEFVCANTGGPCFYTGRDMKTSHAGSGISKANWDKSLNLFADTLKELNVPERESGELAAIVGPLEKDIVDPGK